MAYYCKKEKCRGCQKFPEYPIKNLSSFVMRFIKNGPDVPDPLVEAHEEGRVVFFCGAGISYPAGLPGFWGLVTEIYNRLGETPSSVEQAALDSNQLDGAIGLLERRLNSTKLVREHIAEILKPDFSKPDALATHRALLSLSKEQKDRRRLVTTNFDRIFEHILGTEEPTAIRYSAPLLPVPKKSKWDGLVYLHGLLPDTGGLFEHHRLVVSSGDFGLAYLTERWASRFVTELFRSYVICFVGYSFSCLLGE